jgi:hypothetical protein
VRNVSESSAEEFYSRCLSDSSVLHRASQVHVDEGDLVAACATALAADLSVVQAVIWERLNIAPRAPQRQFFQAGETLTNAMRSFGDYTFPPQATLADLVAEAREGMMSTLDDSLLEQVSELWPDTAYLEGLAAPTDQDVAQWVERRLQGHAVTDFVKRKRVEAAEQMLEAQARRVRGATDEAISSAYDADFAALEAYLVESAVAAGDQSLFSVTTRWDLVVYALSGLTSLPDSFSDAVALIRATMAAALGDADGGRLVAYLPTA